MNYRSLRHGRPPEGAFEVERLTDDGTWIPDDGKPGVAFSGQRVVSIVFGKSHPFPFAWARHPCICQSSRWNFSKDCPCHAATDRTAKRYCCSNGADMILIMASKKATPKKKAAR